MPAENEVQRGLNGFEPILPSVPFMPLDACCLECAVRASDASIVKSDDGTLYCDDHYDAAFTTCHSCNNELARADIVTDEAGNEYHEDCHRELYCECDVCGEEMSRDDGDYHSPEDGRHDYLCTDCYDSRYTHCADCESEVRTGDVTTVGDDDLCNSCFCDTCGTCDECGEAFRNDDLTSNDNGTFCERHYYETDEDDCDDCDCSACRPNRTGGRQQSALPRFSTVANSFQRTRSKRTFGVELETADCHGYPNLRGQFYFSDKEDGSITGREFVSEVLAGDKGLDAISAFCGAANRDKYTVDNKCGFHAHFGVSDLNDGQLRAVAFAYNATYKVWSKFVSRQRRDNSYCTKNSWGYDDITRATDFARWARSIERYQWFNVAAYGAHKTFEVRVHGGTLDGAKINNWVVAHLRFIDAMSQLTVEQVKSTFVGKTEQEVFAAIAEIWDDANLTEFFIKRADKFGTTFVNPAAVAV